MPEQREQMEEGQRTLLTVDARAPRSRRVMLADIVLDASDRRDDALVSSVRRVGLMEPPVLAEQEDGRFKIIAGRRRVAALKQIAAEDGTEATAATEAKVFAPGALTQGDMAALLLTENGNRRENPLVEMRAVLALKRDGYTRAEIARSLNQSPGWVARREQLAALHARLQRELKARRVTFGNAVRMARLPMPEQEHIVADLDQRRVVDPQARASEDAMRSARSVGPGNIERLFTGPSPEQVAVAERPVMEGGPAAATLAIRFAALASAAQGLYRDALAAQLAAGVGGARYSTLVRHAQVAAERLGTAAAIADRVQAALRATNPTEEEEVTDAPA